MLLDSRSYARVSAGGNPSPAEGQQLLQSCGLAAPGVLQPRLQLVPDLALHPRGQDALMLLQEPRTASLSRGTSSRSAHDRPLTTMSSWSAASIRHILSVRGVSPRPPSDLLFRARARRTFQRGTPRLGFLFRIHVRCQLRVVGIRTIGWPRVRRTQWPWLVYGRDPVLAPEFVRPAVAWCR